MVASSALLRERGFAEAKRLCYTGLDAPTLLNEVGRRLGRVVPFEAYCASSNDPLSGLMTHLMHDGVLGEKEGRTYLEHVYFEEDLDAQRRMVQSRSSVALLSEVTGGKLERALRCREITSQIGLGYELLSVCSAGKEQWGGITLIRERGRPDFDAREVTLLHRIIPHVSSGLKAAVLHKQASAEPEGESVPGVLVLDDRGQVVQHTEAAERWLSDLDDLGPSWLEGEGLPAPVWMVVGALRKALKPESDRDLNGVPCVRVQTRSGRWLTFHGARTESRPGRGSETMVVVEPSRPQELAWLRVSAYGLSERERAVVDRVVQGASTKEISQTLYISEYTVQEHLSNVFDKVGVRGRRALLKRLFFDNLYPTLLA
ncbi:MAG TPA: helix-turn-helix transcriptional regulator [Rubrobacter sp.]|jgi:DNA-binding CsgD family transcriptional regulator|nr:helix-turn-helix transcriptional regulator [Rubrobacter sp.]